MGHSRRLSGGVSRPRGRAPCAPRVRGAWQPPSVRRLQAVSRPVWVVGVGPEGRALVGAAHTCFSTWVLSVWRARVGKFLSCVLRARVRGNTSQVNIHHLDVGHQYGNRQGPDGSVAVRTRGHSGASVTVSRKEKRWRKVRTTHDLREAARKLAVRGKRLTLYSPVRSQSPDDTRRGVSWLSPNVERPGFLLSSFPVCVRFSAVSVVPSDRTGRQLRGNKEQTRRTAVLGPGLVSSGPSELRGPGAWSPEGMSSPCREVVLEVAMFLFPGSSFPIRGTKTIHKWCFATKYKHLGVCRFLVTLVSWLSVVKVTG